MKSSRPSRPSVQSSTKSSKSDRSHGTPTSPTMSSPVEPRESRTAVARSQSGNVPSDRSVGVHSQITTVMSQDPVGLDVMRRRMSEALAKKQEQRALSKSPEDSPAENTTPTLSRAPTSMSEEPTEMGSNESLPSMSATMSSDSARTIRAPFDATPGTVRTPSYPFPRMKMGLQRGLSSRSGPHHRPFTLLSPTSEPPELHMGMEEHGYQNASSEMSTPMGRDAESQAYPEDPDHPTPDLYDIVLMLSTEPGLESWWANVTEILAEAYGAERASLALPGDVTDLENVPWGQKASFNINGSDSGDSAVPSQLASDVESTTTLERDYTSPAAQRTRPPLMSRHSIAGVLPERTNPANRTRPTGPIRAISTLPGIHQSQEYSPISAVPMLTRQRPTPQVEPVSEETYPLVQTQDMYSQATSAPRCSVYRSLQRLEAEPEPLLIRTGVAALFGKRKPVVLTRAYSEDHTSHNDMPTPSHGPQQHRDREASVQTIRAFEEYEQPEPSPWSQSPSPSPAARPDPAESPFFTQSSAIDEDAFATNPPNYDYSRAAQQPISAIGTDGAKTLIHIPLIQPVPSRKVLVSSLRFPVAILSFLSPVTPYPRNLRQSLHALLPHLASTFSLAQRYSSLQERFRGGSIRTGPSFGLGGTFSDEGSELELVNELSTQIQQDKALSKASSLAGSVYSPSDKASNPARSPSGSVGGTPYLEHLGMNDLPPTPGRSGKEMVDSYFTAKRNRSGIFGQEQQPKTPGAKSKDVSPERNRKTQTSSEKAAGAQKTKPSIDTSKGKNDHGQSNVNRSASLASESSYDQTPLSGIERIEMRKSAHRDSLKPEEGERNLPELIAALMLNAVPLQLFLAKPTSGDLVWTNRKFDAFRSQGEGRVRDPWKNVHSEDRPELVKLWQEALKTGNQFTHYIRVKRFNSDSDFRWFVFRASTMLSNNGRLIYWVGSFLDVHEQYVKNLEAQEMQASMARDARQRALADAIPQVLFEAVEGEGIVAVNQQWHNFSGQTLEEARGLGFARHVHKDDLHKCGMLSPADLSRMGSESSSASSASSRTERPQQQANPHSRKRSLFAPDDSALAAMIRQGSMIAEKDENGRTSYTTEIRLRSKKGEFRWFLVRLVKIQNDILSLHGASWYGTCTDIEVRMKLERDLNAANTKVHREMESKTKFFANMSHEIRTPLNGILGSMPWLVESQLDHDQRRTLDTIQNSANNLRELVDNILDVTKVEAGKMTLVPKWFNVRNLCEEVVDTVSSRAIERGLELNYTLDHVVPLTVKGDPFRVRQVLLNLMGNSVKFTEQGEVYLRCFFKQTRPGEIGENTAHLAFEVIDTGRGFNETEFKRLFKQFGQIEGASQHDPGSGLGLFLSKQLVEMHGGSLSVASKVGEGSTFSFYITVEVTPQGRPSTTSEHPARPGHRHSVSFGTTSPSQSRSETPVMSGASNKTVVHTPGLSKYASPQTESPMPASPAMLSPTGDGTSSVVSFRSNSANVVTPPSASSNLPTPDSILGPAKITAANVTEGGQEITPQPQRKVSIPLQRAQSDNIGAKLLPEVAHPQTYSIVVICPADYARRAIKEHIEHVVPHQIPVNVTTLASMKDFLDLRHGPTPPVFTHIVLDTPATSDIMLFMRQLATFSTPITPALVVVTDHYQKRDIAEDFMTLTSSGKKAFLVHKPVKPSVFAMIFDPAQLRNLSKDRAREVAQNSTDDFKKIANQVKEAVGNKQFRLLLVEDSDTNRMVIQRYLKRVGLASDEARDGQECVDKVRSRPHGYYNLIICDIQMPKKNGYEACLEVRQWERDNAYPNLPIMALTANAMPEERAAAGAAGFTDYLTKPVDFNRLGRLMITLLDPKVPHGFLREQQVDMGKIT